MSVRVRDHGRGLPFSSEAETRHPVGTAAAAVALVLAAAAAAAAAAPAPAPAPVVEVAVVVDQPYNQSRFRVPTDRKKA